MPTAKPITEMSDEELLEERRALRTRRAISMESRRGPRKGRPSPGSDFEALFGGPDEEPIDEGIAGMPESEVTDD